jgi:hypothetical protein
MGFESWHAFYQSDLQSVYALLVLPGLFLLYLLGTGRWRASEFEQRDARFLRLYCLAFAFETLLDPIATGPIAKAVGGAFPTAAGLLFVLLGDFRVVLLLFGLCGGDRNQRRVWGEALLWTPAVAVSAFALAAALDLALGQQPPRLLWLIHELLFVAMACWLRGRVVPSRTLADLERRGALQRIAGFVVVYYGLWATADVLILFGGFDWGYLLRAIPNQLYYALWIPFVYFTLSTRTSAEPGSRFSSFIARK